MQAARQLEYGYQYGYGNAIPKERVLQRQRLVKKIKVCNVNCTRFVLTLALFAFCLGILCLAFAVKRSEVAQLNYEINNTKKQLAMIEGDSSKIKVEILQCQSIDRMNVLAQDKLKMKQPALSDVQYLN